MASALVDFGGLTNKQRDELLEHLKGAFKD
jgi:hypothetical protein